MSDTKNADAKLSLRQNLITIAPLILGLVILLIFINLMGFWSIVNTVKAFSPSIMFIAFILNGLGLLLYGVAWYILIKASGSFIRFKVCLGAALAAIFMYYLMPSGFFLEAVRIMIAEKEAKVKIGVGTATVVMHRILFLFGFIIYGILSIVALTLEFNLSIYIFQKYLIAIGALLFGTIAALYLPLNVSMLDKLTQYILKKIKPFILKFLFKYGYESTLDQIKYFLNDFREGFKSLVKNKHHLVLALFAIMGYWFTSVLIMFLTFKGLNYEVPIWIPIFAMIVGDLIQMTPIIIPGMLGIFETAVSIVLNAFKIPINIAVSATLLSRIATFWFDIPITGIAAMYFGTKYMGKTFLKLSKPLFETNNSMNEKAL
ncbi:MAG: flippase-like domain-containing protein [Candidatus Bathyarchaeia archaeon]